MIGFGRPINIRFQYVSEKVIHFLACILFSSYSFAVVEVDMLHVGYDDEANLRNIFQNIVDSFEAQNPRVKVNIEYIDNEEYKKTITKRLTSKKPPDLFYSWGGFNFRDKAEKGLLRDISDHRREFKRHLYRNGLKSFTHKGKLYGAPYLMTQVGFWYNRDLFYKAGVSTADIQDWKGFLETVVKIKKAGITPIALGAADKWPVHFYWSYLAMRAGGFSPFLNAMVHSGKQFEHPAFIRAGKEFQRLVELKPFQEGFEDASYADSAKAFGNRKAAIHLMGDWDYTSHKELSDSGKGIEDKRLGWFAFPKLEGGVGTELDVLGGINGFVASHKASDEAIQWLSFLLSYENQGKLAADDEIIPSARRAGFYLKNPFKKYIFENIHLAEWHQVFLDQEFGSNTGSSINDNSYGLLTGKVTPSQAARNIQLVWGDG